MSDIRKASELKFGGMSEPEDYEDSYRRMGPRAKASFKKWIEQFNLPSTTKLTAEQALKIILSVRSGNATPKEMAKKYGVSESTVRDAVSGRRWAKRLHEGGYLDAVEHAPHRGALSRREELEVVDLLRDAPLSIPQIAKDYGVCVATIYRISAKHNRSPRHHLSVRRAYRPVRRGRLSDQQKRDLCKMVVVGGCTYRDAAEHFGISTSYAYAIANDGRYDAQ